MKLEGFYYQLVEKSRKETGSAVYHVELLPDCKVYQGHFPGNPVCPGVFNMQLIKECAEKETGKSLHVDKVKQCRLTALATPKTSPKLNVCIQVDAIDDAHYQVVASIYNADHVFMEYKGSMSV